MSPSGVFSMDNIYAVRVENAGQQYELPDLVNSRIGFEGDDLSAVTITYPKLGRNADQLVENSWLILLVGGVEVKNGRYLMLANDLDQDTASPNFKMTGVDIRRLLWWTITAPRNGDWNDPTNWQLDDMSAGDMIDRLFDDAQARGAMHGLTWSFNATTNSRGNAWDNIHLSRKYKVGMKYGSILQGLVASKHISWWIKGGEIFVTNYLESGDDVSATVKLTSGLDYEEIPSRTNIADAVSHVAVRGDKGHWAFTSDAGNLTKWGHREATIQQGGVRDTGLLTLAGNVFLDSVGDVREQLTRRVRSNPDNPVFPLRDYLVGDTIYDDVSVTAVKQQIKAITLNVDGQGGWSADVTMKDRLLPQEVRDARRLASLLDDATSGNVPDHTAPDKDDDIGPKQVTNLACSSDTYMDRRGRTHAVAVFTWDKPTQDTDGTKYRDHHFYVFKWKYASDGGTKYRVRHSRDNAQVLSPLDTNRTINVIVYAVDINGNDGVVNPAYPADFALAEDTTNPPAPTTPTLRAKAGNIIVKWDGAFVSADPGDVKRVVVHADTTNNFTPDWTSTGTRIGTLDEKGKLVVSDFTYGSTYYFKLVAVDDSGNRSTPSTQASIVHDKTQRTDIASKAISTTEIDDHAVDTLQIADDAVTPVKLDVSVYDLFEPQPDGFAPSTFPTPTVEPLGVGGLRAYWTPVTNTDPVTYDVYIFANDDGSSPGTLNSASLAGSTPANQIPIARMPDGTALDSSIVYGIYVRARDADGSGPTPTLGGVGSPRQATNDDIAADYVYGNTIEAAQMNSGVMSAILSIIGGLQMAEVDSDGDIVPGSIFGSWDPTGFFQYDNTGAQRVIMDPVNAIYRFVGEIIATHLTVTDGSLQGGENELAEGAVMTLQSGVTTPKNSPGFQITYDMLDMHVGTGAARRGLVKIGSNWYILTKTATGAAGIVKVDATTGALVAETYTPNALEGPTLGGLAYDGTNLLAMMGFADTYKVYKINPTTLVWDAGSLWVHGDGNRRPAIGYDSVAGEILIAQSRFTDDKVRIRRYTYNLGGTLTNSATGPVDSAFTYPQDLCWLAYGTMDFAGNRYAFMKSDSAASIKVINTSGTEQAGDEFPTSASVIGMHWDTSNFYSVETDGLLRKYEGGSGNRWTTSTDENWGVASDLFRSTGSLHTASSPIATFVMKKRAKLIVTVANLPTGGATPPTAARIYLWKGTGTFVQSGGWLQGSAVGTAPPILTITNAVFSGTHDPTTTTFAAGNKSIIRNAVLQQILASDDEPLWTSYTVTITGSGSNPTQGNSTYVGKYRRIGKTVEYSITITIGSSFVVGSGAYRILLPPFTPAGAAGDAVGTGGYDDANGTNTGGYTAKISATAGRISLFGAGGAVGAASPVVPATGDVITVMGRFDTT